MVARWCSILPTCATSKSSPNGITHRLFSGFTHTVLTLFERGLWIVSDECVQDNGADWPKLVWLVWLVVFLLPRASQSVTKWVDLCLAIFIEPLN